VLLQFWPRHARRGQALRQSGRHSRHLRQLAVRL
jgi:hypothetical protein